MNKVDIIAVIEQGWRRIRVHTWDRYEYDTALRTIRSVAWHYHLVVSTIDEYGNGHYLVSLVESQAVRPRVCSGTRGRGRKQAAKKRAGLHAKMPWINWVTKHRMVLRFAPREVQLMAAHHRARRGPKGNR